MPNANKQTSVEVSLPVDVLAVGEGGHLTTRAHNRHLIYHARSGTWYAFVGTATALVEDAAGANALFSSTDGVSWKLEHTFCHGYGTSSSQDVLLVGDKIYLLHWPNDWQQWDERYGGTPGKYPVEYQVRTYPLSESAGEPMTYHDDTAIRCTNHQLHFYGSLCYDTNRILWIGTRFHEHGTEGITRAFVARSSHPDAPSAWEDPLEIGRREGNSVAPDLSSLDDGRVIAINHYSPFSGERGKATIAACLYDPALDQWLPEYEVALGNAAKRLRGVAEFDLGSRRLHLVYPDEKGDVRHKILSTPFGPDNWSPEAGEDVPGELVVTGSDDDLSMALDLSRNPASITLVYRREGIVYRKDYDGDEWLDNDRQLVTVSDQSAELSLNLDASQKLGLLFLDTEPDRGKVIKFLEIGQR